MAATATRAGTVKRLIALDAPILHVPTSLMVLGGEGEMDVPASPT